MARTLVTGGAGFIGSHLVRRLVAEGHEVHVLARPATSLRRLGDLAAQVTIWRADVTDAAGLEKCVASVRPRTVFHLASDTSGRLWSPELREIDSSVCANLQGTLNLVRSLHRHRPERFVRAGSLAEYGNNPAPFDSTRRDRPVSAYGASLAATTMILAAMSSELAFPVLTLRLAAVYGPAREEAFFLPSLIRACLENRDFEMTTGSQRWDLIHVDDAVAAFMNAVRADVPSGEWIDIGSGHPRPLAEVAELTARKIGGSGRILRGARSILAGDVPELYCDTARARELLGWEARVDLDSGLDQTIAWYRREFARTNC